MRQRMLLFAIIILALASPAFGATQPTLRFAVIGDRTGGHVDQIYDKIIKEVAELRPDFSITVGDQIEGYTNDSLQLIAQWEQYDSIVKPLPSRLYLTPGNHDIFSDFSERIYRKYVGEPYYSFDNNGCHFVVLDVSRWEFGDTLPKPELNWLASDLKANQAAAHTFVFFHKPYWIQAVERNQPDTLHQIFRRYGVDAVFNGHFHEYFSGNRDGIIYTAVGSSGADPGEVPGGLQYHFTWVTVDSAGIHIAPIKYGSVLPWDNINMEDKLAIDRIRNFGLTFSAPAPVEQDLTVKDTVIELRVNNSFSSAGCDDTLHWSVPANWSVEPQSMSVKIAAGETKTLEFRVKCNGKLYPAPTASLTFGYGENGKIEVTKDLAVARELTCYKIKSPVILDGAITESFWQYPVNRFFAPDGGEVTIDPESFYFAHDDDNVYLAAQCVDPKIDSIAATVTERDGWVAAEDCVGFFLEPVKGSNVVYQLYINPLGTIFDQKITKDATGWTSGDKNWNADCEVKASKGSGFWSVEVKIPVKQFGVQLKSGEQWRLNFRRKEPRLHSAADWQAPIDYDPETYGIMTIQ